MRFSHPLYITLVFIGLLFSSFSLPAQAETKAVTETINIGILAYRNENTTSKRWHPLITYLNQKIPNHHFQLVTGNYTKLNQLIQQNKIDFLLTQPSHYVALTYRHNLSSPLVSMLNKEGEKGQSVFGGVIFTLADNKHIQHLADIRDKTIATPSKKSLGAFQMQIYELMQQGVIRKESDLTLTETGLPQISAIHAVLNKTADIGFVRSGVLEKLFKETKLRPEQLKIIHQQEFANFPLISSTQLYPEWPFASFQHTDKSLSKEVTIALLSIENQSELAKHLNISGFTIAENYRTIDQLLRALHLPPFDQEKIITLLDVWQQWQKTIHLSAYIVLLIVLLITVHLYKKNKTLNSLKHRLIESNLQLQKLNIAVDQSPIRIIITDVKGRIGYANRATEEQSGFSFSELHNKTPNIFSSGEIPSHIFQELWKTVKRGNVWHGDLINLSKTGQRQLLKTTITPIKDDRQKITGFLSIQRDITQEQESQDKIRRLAYYDRLTGLANRQLLEKRLYEEIANNLYQDLANIPSDQHFYLILINIDQFKIINDANGKTIGDRLLKKFSERLKEFVTNNDLLARLTADEFAILCALPNHKQDHKEVQQKSEQILHRLKAPFEIQGQDILLSNSIGITPIFKNEDSVNEILKYADTALHSAKAKGGNQMQLFDKSLEQRAVEHFQIEQNLKTALKQHQFTLHYQPQVNSEGELIGVESLIRWQHPEKGFIPPTKFIPIAEQSDLIIDIGYWVLQEACKASVHAYQNGLSYNLSVNISPRQLLQQDFCQRLLTILADYQMPADHLTLEITEGLFLHDLAEILPVMHQLAPLGIMFSIDDFGTGYSSLAYLKNLPVTEIKIDRSFIHQIVTDRNDAVLVESILSIAEHMGFTVVAEGIETEQQAEFFKHRDNVLFQGYLYGKPVPYETLYQTWLPLI